MAKTVVGVFDNIDEARYALDELNTEGYPSDGISLIASDADSRFTTFFGRDDGAVDRGVQPGESTVFGVGAGVAIGAIAGLVVGLAAMAIPGIGPIIAAGPLVSLIVGAEIGAVAGGLIGALVHLGIPEHDAHFYADRVRRGGTLLVLRADDSVADHAATIMRDNGAADVDGHADRLPAESSSTAPADDSAAYIPTAAAAAGAANFAVTGSPGAPGAFIGALTAPALDEERADAESEPTEYTVVDKRSRPIDAEEHDRDEEETKQHLMNRQI